MDNNSLLSKTNEKSKWRLVDRKEHSETRLVIGINYGAYFPGFAYSTPFGFQCSLIEIDVIQNSDNGRILGPNNGRILSIISNYPFLKTDIVLTVPSKCSYTTMNATYRSFTKAGFDSQRLPSLRDVLIVTETDAASAYLAKLWHENPGQWVGKTLREGDTFILCDAGGSSFTAASYCVRSLYPCLQLESIGSDTSEYDPLSMNNAFKAWLRRTIGIENYLKLDPYRVDLKEPDVESSGLSKVLYHFEVSKCTFSIDSPSEMEIDLPHPLEDLCIHQNTSSPGKLIILRKEMEEFFLPRVLAIVNLIEGQTRVIDYGVTTTRPKVFLIGDLSRSEYLRDKLANHPKMQALGLIRSGDWCWMTVLQGAVVCGAEKGINPGILRASPSRYDYAIHAGEAVSPSDKVDTDANETSTDGDPITWFIKQGDLLINQSHRVEREIDLSWTLSERKHQQRFQILRRDGSRSVRYSHLGTEVQTLCTMAFDRSVVPMTKSESVMVILKGTRNRTNIRIKVKLILVLENKHVNASVWWDKTELCKTHVSDRAEEPIIDRPSTQDASPGTDIYTSTLGQDTSEIIPREETPEVRANEDIHENTLGVELRDDSTMYRISDFSTRPESIYLQEVLTMIEESMGAENYS